MPNIADPASPMSEACGSLVRHMWLPRPTHVAPSSDACGSLVRLVWLLRPTHVVPSSDACGSPVRHAAPRPDTYRQVTMHSNLLRVWKYFVTCCNLRRLYRLLPRQQHTPVTAKAAAHTSYCQGSSTHRLLSRQQHTPVTAKAAALTLCTYVY